MSQSSHRSGAKGLRRFAIFEKILMHQNGKIGSLQEWMLQKLQILSENVLHKNCTELNFISIHVSPSSLGVKLGSSEDILGREVLLLTNVQL